MTNILFLLVFFYRSNTVSYLAGTSYQICDSLIPESRTDISNLYLSITIDSNVIGYGQPEKKITMGYEILQD